MRRSGGLLIVGNKNSMHLLRWSRFLDDLSIDYDLYSLASGGGFAIKARREFSAGFAVGLGASKALKLLKGVVLASRYRIVNIHYLSLPHALVALSSRGKLVLTCLGSDVLVLLKKSKGLRRFLLAKALEKAAVITCDAGSVKKALMDGKIPAEKIRIVTWGVDTEEFTKGSPEGRADARARFGLPLDSVVLLSPRGVRPIYRIADIIQAFKKNIHDKRIRLFIHVGVNPDKDYLEKCMGLAEGEENISFNLRTLDPEELPILYEAADACLHFPESDASPVSLLEGLAKGNAMLCGADIPAYEELSLAYRIMRIDLGAIDDSAVAECLKMRRDFSEENRKTLIEKDSRERSAKTIEGILRSLE